MHGPLTEPMLVTTGELWHRRRDCPVRHILLSLLASIMLVSACAPGSTPLPTPTPTATAPPTATPTETPLPTLWASAEAKDCLLNPSCSGLFTTGRVIKAEVLRSTEPARYWISPQYSQLLNRFLLDHAELPQDFMECTACFEAFKRNRIKHEFIRNRIMPIIEQWTHRSWAEHTSEQPDSEDILLRWYDSIPETWSPLTQFRCHSYRAGGCATTGEGAIVLNTPNVTIGLHEAVHALYGAEHTSEDGLMFHNDDLTRQTPLLRPVDEEVYALYGSPLLTHGMNKEFVEQIVLVRE